MKTIKEIFEELNKPKNKLKMISRLIKEQERKEAKNADTKSEQDFSK